MIMLTVMGKALLYIILFICLILVAAIAFGGPKVPKAAESINAEFSKVDFSQLPALKKYAARDGVSMAYRFYKSILPVSLGSAVLIHGSSANSSSMHPLAQALSNAGFNVYALDMRGHGQSGTKGSIKYVGQLEDDIMDFIEEVNPSAPRTLVGFSGGGGVALRFAGSERQQLFDRYLLLSPFIHQDAAVYKKDSKSGVSIGLPRIIALTILNKLHITAFNDLPVFAFGFDDSAKEGLTPTYSYALFDNFRPQEDYKLNIREAKQPMSLITGQKDEFLYAEKFEDVFKEAGYPLKVQIVPGVGHIGLTLDEAGIKAITSEMTNLKKQN